jgi:hypothetical protein
MTQMADGKVYDTRIPLYQWEAGEFAEEATAGHPGTSSPFTSARHDHWGPTGRWLLGAWLAALRLDRSDVVTILTTSQEQYVSICVSVTSFNYASVSRVITDRTRVIIVIHEFGYIDTTLPEQIEEWRSRGILVLEDCAFVAGVRVGSGWVGDYGDAALFSMPKIIPARAGGLLRTREPFALPPMTEAGRAATTEARAVADASLPFVERFNALRLERHELLRDGLGLPPWDPPRPVVAVPFFSMYTDPEQDAYKAVFPSVFWGTATLVPGRLQVPTNPLVPLDEFKTIIDYIRTSRS